QLDGPFSDSFTLLRIGGTSMKRLTCIQEIAMVLLAIGPMAGCSSKFIVTKISQPPKSSANVSGRVETARAATGTPNGGNALLADAPGGTTVSPAEPAATGGYGA